jgi:hypothetical protein
MEVGQGPNWGCSAKEKKYFKDVIFVYVFLGSYNFQYAVTHLILVGYLVVLYGSVFVSSFTVVFFC